MQLKPFAKGPAAFAPAEEKPEPFVLSFFFQRLGLGVGVLFFWRASGGLRARNGYGRGLTLGARVHGGQALVGNLY